MAVTELELTETKTKVLEQDSPPTETKPLLQRLWRKLRTIGATQDSCITVIENPAADSYGYIGLLFATHFTEKQTVRYFTDVNYFRINTNNFKFLDQDTFHKVHIINPPNRLINEQLMVDNTTIILPRPSESPYRVAFFDPDHYDYLLNRFIKNHYPELSLKELNASLAQKIDNFYLNERTGLLKLPENYARLKIPLNEAA